MAALPLAIAPALPALGEAAAFVGSAIAAAWGTHEAIEAMQNAEDEGAGDLSDTQADTTECTGDCEERNCPTKRFCFNNSRYVGTPKQAVFDTQLAVQEAQMNSMSPTQIINNRAKYQASGRAALERLPGVPEARAMAVERWMDMGGSGSLQSQGLAVLHRLDMVAGGNPLGYYAVGDAGINSSIGRSWAHKTAQLDTHAEQSQANGCRLMHVDLYSSPACPDGDG